MVISDPRACRRATRALSTERAGGNDKAAGGSIYVDVAGGSAGMAGEVASR